MDTAWLQREAAVRLARANNELRRRRPDLHLLVTDALRPRSAQIRMWDLLRNTPNRRYVADPSGGSMHNFGVAVDVTIQDGAGRVLDMGCPVDFFGPAAQPRMEEPLLRKGRLTAEQVANRRLLRAVMVAAGYRPLAIEWWHFDAFDHKTARARFPIVE